LTVATFATLFLVPVIYSLLRCKPPFAAELPDSDLTGNGAQAAADRS